MVGFMGLRQLSLVAFGFIIAGCGSSGSGSNASAPVPTPAPTLPPANTGSIKLNQLGFLPSSNKLAVVPTLVGTEFIVRDTADDTIVMTAQSGEVQTWVPSDESVSAMDFSSVTTEGNYEVEVPSLDLLSSFSVLSNVYLNAHDAALKAYYFNRAGQGLNQDLAGKWSRTAGHPDTRVLVHQSAATTERPEGTVISAPKGWYDAGDYNKYVVNSGISTYTLLIAFEHYSAFYQNRDIGIPESGDSVPDILDEAKWNLDWMLAMQDPNDGGVYHKLTTLSFSGAVMPHEADAPRFVVQKGTSASLNFAAVMAVASRIYHPYFPDFANQYQQASLAAWRWALANDDVAYNQPPDVSTGAYGDSQFEDEFAWAAAELYLLTEDESYLNYFKDVRAQLRVPSWSNTSALSHISLLDQGRSKLSDEDYTEVKGDLLALADMVVDLHLHSAYKVAMQNTDFVWGSNAVAMNKAIILLQAFHQTSDNKYKDAATSLLDYVLGRNPTDYSYLTGYGNKTPMQIHHRQSEADDVIEPVPGFLAGGAQNGQQDKCDYPSDLPAKSYLDDYCSYSTNEVTINWNAPLVYVLAGLHNIQ